MSPREEEQRAFLETYWRCLVVEPDWERFASIVAEDCVVHYPGNHFLSGDHVGRAAVVRLYQTLRKLGPDTGTFIGELPAIRNRMPPPSSFAMFAWMVLAYVRGSARAMMASTSSCARAGYHTMLR